MLKQRYLSCCRHVTRFSFVSTIVIFVIIINFLLPLFYNQATIFKKYNLLKYEKVVDVEHIKKQNKGVVKYMVDVNKTYTDISFANSNFNFTKNKKLIIIWSPFFSGWDFLPVGTNTFSGCLETRCEITNDRRRLSESHAVFFHIRTISLTDLPLLRHPSQKWIFFSLESPPHSFFPGFYFMYNMFNWTMTYRSDSDVVIRYDNVRILNTNFTEKSFMKSDWKQKTKMAVWMVSHCSTPGNREGYIRELQKYLDVDVFGSCGFAMCPQNKTLACMAAFAQKYKFFLAFENSICNDYITEKFFLAIKFNIVPVVFGGVNYNRIVPNNSYIDALEFASPEKLASYLKRVSKNITLYYTYLKWKTKGTVISGYSSHCGLCTKLHSKDFDKKTVYPDIAEWWVKRSQCRRWPKKH